jgi:hypothetical protein
VTLNYYEYLKITQIHEKDTINLREAIRHWHENIYWISGAWLDINSFFEFDIILQNMAEERYLAYIDEWMAANRFMEYRVYYRDIGFSIGVPYSHITQNIRVDRLVKLLMLSSLSI